MPWTEDDLRRHLQARARRAAALRPVVSEAPTTKRRHKYRAEPTIVDNIRFDSRKEANRYLELKLLEYVGSIRDLTLQPRYDLIACNGEICGTFRADFKYFDLAKQREEVEDVKGGPATRTEAYRLRKRFAEACHGIRITEI